MGCLVERSNSKSNRVIMLNVILVLFNVKEIIVKIFDIYIDIFNNKLKIYELFPFTELSS